jgi:DNA polymerase-3 subunit gamma/tau
MSYLVLARKWRPKSFDTLVGQEHVVRALTHALESRRLHHAYLFTGTRGIGKTTLARILAKALNCETGISAKPCGTCSACLEIDSGRFVDYLELDAASNRGVDEMAQLLEQAAYMPSRGRFKVFVIDEVHQLTGHAFNAMLKTLEEPPEHVKFILATTDPQKIPVTVLSRCLQFNLKQMPPQYIVDHLSRVLEAEGIAFDLPALRLLARAAAGSMRDALSLLDQAIAHGAGRVEEEAVRDMLGTVGEDHLFGVLDGLADNDVRAMLSVADAMDARSLSFDSALQELATLVHRIALFQLAPEAIADAAERLRLAPYAERFDAEFLQLAYQILIQGRADLALAPDECSGFTMTLLRLVAFRPDTPPPLGAPSRAPQNLSVAASGGGATLPAAKRPDAARMPVAGADVQRPVSAAGNDPDWRQLTGSLNLGGLVRELAQHCEWVGQDGALVRLRLSPTHKSLLTKVAADKLQGELSSHFGRPLKLQVDIGEPEGETPAQRLRSEQQARHNDAVAALEQDGFVRDMIDMFDATINESTVKPI